MKNMLAKEFWMEVRKSRARFISIFCIVALGVSFYSGIQSASPDMRYSGDVYYDKSQLMNIQVQGTLGLTDDDVRALLDINGVEKAQGSYSTDLILEEADTQKVLHVEAVLDDFNLLTVQEGRVPNKTGECFMDSAYAQTYGYKLGDVIELKEDGDNKLLSKHRFAIAGIGRSPLYISYNRGNTTLGTGELNGFLYIMPEDFESDVYTQIYLTVSGAQDLTSYTDSYDILVEELTTQVKGIQDVRCESRYTAVMDEANTKIADAEQELADGKAEADEKLSDAEKELSDGEKDLADGKKELADGKKQLADAKKEVADGWKQLEDARKQLSDGKIALAEGLEELLSGQAQLADARAQLEDGRAQLTAGWSQYYSGKEELDANEAKLAAGQAQLEAGKAEAEQGWAQLKAAEEELNAGKATLNEKEAELTEGKAALEAAKAELSANKTALTEGQAQARSQLSQVEQGIAQTRAALDVATGAAVAQIQAELETLNGQKAALESGLAEIESQFGDLEAGQAQISEKESQLAAGEETISEKKAEIAAAESQIAENKKKLEAADEKIADSEAELKSGQDQLAAGAAQLSSAYQTLISSEATIASGEEQIAANEQKLADGNATLAESQQKITDGEKEIADNEQKLKDAEKEISDNEKKLKDAEKDIADGEKELSDGRKEYEDAKKEADQKIADGEEKIADAKAELADLEYPKWYVTDRDDLPEYSDYGDNALRIKNIGKVFPVIFFLVAALISLTTMTRMVEEQRTQIGTMKALGYGKAAIAGKYVMYAFLATIGGSIVGYLIGEKIFPWIIITAYGMMYQSVGANIQLNYQLKYGLIATGASLVCTIGATVFSCWRELNETPASLMRPPAPKEGKRVLVERISFLWKHLSFTWKSTIRNLFRYKKRFFMTLFGIAGSMGLMLVGFGIRDSIMDIADIQYSRLQHYDGVIIMDDAASSSAQSQVDDYLKNSDKIERYSRIQMTKLEASNGHSKISPYLYVSEDQESFKKDITLKNRLTGEIYDMPSKGAVISEKTSSLLGLEIGDTLTLIDDKEEIPVTVSLITENYMGHYVYMTPQAYKDAFGKDPDFAGSIVFTIKEEYKDQANEIGQEILDHEAALSINYISSNKEMLERMLGTLSLVIVVLIISAGALAFVVLFNLNNINITERQRELATLKVLGFYDNEVSSYVFRENVLLTILGIVCGCFLGILLHRFIIVTVEVDAVMFGRNIKPLSFVYCAIITAIFSMIVNVFMHRKLQKIDMVESLKSVE